MFKKKINKLIKGSRRVARQEARLIYQSTGFDIIAAASNPGALLKHKSVTSSLELEQRILESKPAIPSKMSGKKPPPAAVSTAVGDNDLVQATAAVEAAAAAVVAASAVEQFED